MAELEELIELYRTFAANAPLSTPADRSEIRKLLKKTHKVLGPPSGRQPELPCTDDQEAKVAPSGDDQEAGALVQHGKRANCTDGDRAAASLLEKK